MISIGNQTAFSASSFTEPFDYAVAHNFDAFEWFPDKKAQGSGWDDQDLSPALRAQIRETAQARNMRLSVHARWTVNPLLPEAAPLLLREIQLAKDLGAKVLVLHLYTEQRIPAYAKAILPLLPIAASSELQIAIENTVHTSPSDFNEFFNQLNRSPHLDHVGMCFDMGHANLCSATRNDYLRFLDNLDPTIPFIHLHLHENWGDADSHLTVFTGPAAHNDTGIRGLIRRLKQRGFSGSAILEQWPQPASLLDQARERLLKIWNGEENTATRKPIQTRKTTPEPQVSKSKSRDSGETRRPEARVEATSCRIAK